MAPSFPREDYRAVSSARLLSSLGAVLAVNRTVGVVPVTLLFLGLGDRSGRHPWRAEEGRPSAIIDSTMAAGKAQLIVRNLDPKIVAALRVRAARHGRSVEAEHRDILLTTLQPRRKRRTLKEALLSMPNVGTDRDFQRGRQRARVVRF
jgi:plasmid stability protein